MSNEMKTEKDILDGVIKAETQRQREILKQCEWDDPNDVALYRSASNRETRRLLLEKLVPSRICPCCRTVRASVRSWVVDKTRKHAICRSCFHSGVGAKVINAEGTERQEIRRDIFGHLVYRVEIDGFKLSAARREAGIKMTTFARMVGWSRIYQVKLENNQVKTVSLETAEAIIEIFNRFGFRTLDCL